MVVPAARRANSKCISERNYGRARKAIIYGYEDEHTTRISNTNILNTKTVRIAPCKRRTFGRRVCRSNGEIMVLQAHAGRAGLARVHGVHHALPFQPIVHLRLRPGDCCTAAAPAANRSPRSHLDLCTIAYYGSVFRNMTQITWSA